MLRWPRLFDTKTIEGLAVAVLAVGGWPPARLVDALAPLRDAGVMAPTEVAGMDLGVLTVKLAKNGYDRGLLTSMYAERLQAVFREIAAGHLEDLPALVASGDEEEFARRLRAIHGIGPKVAKNAWLRLTSQ